MSDPVVTEIAGFEAPFRRQILLQHVAHESGLNLMRIRIREGNRFTILDIDATTAMLWGNHMRTWAATSATDSADGA